MNRTVLIVEDDRDLREAIGEILEHDRFHVMHAAHGAEAIDILRTSRELPESDGWISSKHSSSPTAL